eukprot:scaffold104062_cov42-Phaeocystis_antarctica.AAC.2
MALYTYSDAYSTLFYLLLTTHYQATLHLMAKTLRLFKQSGVPATAIKLGGTKADAAALMRGLDGGDDGDGDGGGDGDL